MNKEPEEIIPQMTNPFVEKSGVTDDFDCLVKRLQQEVTEQALTVSEKVSKELHNPKNVGRILTPDACAIVRGWCGDTMEIYLRLDGERIREASFTTDGCWSTVACGSMLTRMATGMSLAEAAKIEPEDLIVALDGLPEENVHCAELAVNTLREAIKNESESKVEH